MRTTAAAASNAANQDGAPAVFWDAQFRDVKDRIVDPPPQPDGAQVADTHAHLDMLHYPELALARSAVHHVDFLVTVVDPTEDPSYTLNNLPVWKEKAAELLFSWIGEKPDLPIARAISGCNLPTVRVIIGCHPHNAAKYDAGIEEELLKVICDPLTTCIGEIGLDYHYDLSPREVQQRVFRRQIRLAHEHGLPIAVHLREAHDDGLRILLEEGAPRAGVLLHCFNLDYARLEPFLALGCEVAYGGPLTFKKSDEVREAARRTPLDRLMTETDAPFMAPHPVRGVVCGPEHVVYTAACLADTFELDDGDKPGFYQQVFDNAVRFFG
jgi:TatD DNase family protein